MARVSFSAVWKRTEPASALLVAALAAMLLATAGGLMLIETRAARLGAGEMLRLAQAKAGADALLAEALIRLDSDSPLPTQGLLFETETGRVWRQDAAGLLDINAADPGHLAALLIAAGATQERAAQLADSIADWRDVDDVRRLHGAETRDYADAALAPPGNRPFATEDEILAVLGMDASLAACLKPWLTTYSGSSNIDPSAAPSALRAALGLAAGAPSAGAPLGRVIMLSAEAPLSEHAVLRRTLWIRLTGSAHQAVLTHRAAETLAPVGSFEPPLPCAPAEVAS